MSNYFITTDRGRIRVPSRVRSFTARGFSFFIHRPWFDDPAKKPDECFSDSGWRVTERFSGRSTGRICSYHTLAEAEAETRRLIAEADPKTLMAAIVDSRRKDHHAS